MITGTGTGVGKTMVTAAIAALAVADGQRVAVVKPAQTGVSADEPGDVAEVVRLSGAGTAREYARYPEPLAPATAARRAGMAPVRPAEVAAEVAELASTHDLVLVEGAGGLLVRFDDEGATLADIAWSLSAPLLVVAEAGLGTLNATALTTEVAEGRGLHSAGVVIGSWPAGPGLAEQTNLHDLPVVAGAPLLGVLPEASAGVPASEFRQRARRWLSPVFGGEFDADAFVRSGCAQ